MSNVPIDEVAAIAVHRADKIGEGRNDVVRQAPGVEIRLLDHLVVAGDSFASLAERELI